MRKSFDALNVWMRSNGVSPSEFTVLLKFNNENARDTAACSLAKERIEERSYVHGDQPIVMYRDRVCGIDYEMSVNNVSVKKLEFRKHRLSDRLSYADTILGYYRVWTHDEAGGKWFWEIHGNQFTVGSERDAKYAAQEHFEQQVHSLIVDP